MVARKVEFSEGLAESIVDEAVKPKRTRAPRKAAAPAKETAPVAEVVEPKPKRRTRISTKNPEFPVETIKVNSSVWAAALKIADGNPRRIEIISHNKVKVS